MRGLALTVIAAASNAAFSQPAVAWSKVTALSGASHNSPRFVKTDSAGNSYVVKTRSYRNTTGSQGYVEVQRFSSTGAVTWTKTIIGAGSGLGTPVALNVDSAGNVVVGYYDYFTFFTSNLNLVKLNGATGAVIWDIKTFSVFFYGTGGIGSDSSNNLFLLGQGSTSGDVRMAVTKLNGATGAVLWTKTVTRAGAGVSDIASALKVDAANNVAVVGTVESSDPCNTTFKSPIVVGRLRGTDGLVLWVKTHTAVASDDNLLPRVDTDTAGNVFAAATAQRSPFAAWLTAKFVAATGALSFSKVYAPMSPILSFCSDMAVDSTGGVGVAGAGFDMTGSALALVRYSSTGVQSWAKQLADRTPSLSFGIGTSARQLVAHGTNFLTCGTRDTTTGMTDTSVSMVSKLVAATGVVSWDKVYNPVGGSKTEATAIAAASNGDAVVVSSVKTNSNTNPYIQGATARFLTASGNLGFSNVAGNAVNPTPEFATDLIIDTGNFSYTAGSSAGRMVTQKFNAAGTMIWQNIYDEATVDDASNETDGSISVRRDATGNVIVTGHNRGQGVVLKLSGTTGGILWKKRFNASFGRNCAINGAGDVYVPCTSPSQVLKLAAATGNTTWTAPVNPPGAFDESQWVELDSAGNVFVAGQTTNTTACPDQPDEKVFVQRLNPASGAKVWERVIGGPVTGDNSLAGLAVDSSKNVLIGGTSDSAANSDYFGAKINGTSGAVLWNTRHDDLARNQRATALVMDGANNLVITGGSLTGATADGWTIKLLNSSGARSWASKLTSPAGPKFPSDVARDSANNIYVGGTIGGASSAITYGQKLAAATGASTWLVQRTGALGGNEKFNVLVAVSTTNRLHVHSTATSAGIGLANMVLAQYNP